MNNAMTIRRRQKTGLMTRIILLISFLILLGRLLYTIPGAIEHHQQKKAQPEPTTISSST
ncbi:DUF2633 domain-containing protein [Paramixta manurensis]|uniref:DUF2633 domain-containing protein n=2 Tax=Paramixta manurensis TaxID=2740817 RepID=A0A6M8UIG3_9GAMM|nr:DUF2633 domain-containing protein [Erwiniaceae bacterium PD-1]